MPLTICAQFGSAQTDVCLLHRASTILLVVASSKLPTNETPIPPEDVEARKIAEAVAAYEFNNRERAQYGLQTLDVMMIPCITMDGTRPTFYLVPVTRELSEAVISGMFPPTETRVIKCVTAPTHKQRFCNEMTETEYRRLALKRFIAFKTLAKSHWINLLDEND